jgi:hypothetical protein
VTRAPFAPTTQLPQAGSARTATGAARAARHSAALPWHYSATALGYGARLPIQPGQRLRSFADLLDQVLAARGERITPAAPATPGGAAATPTSGGTRSGAVGAVGSAAAARLGAGPLALGDYPRPPGDNGRGLHWIPTGAQPPEVVDRFVAEARAMKIKWVTFLNDGAAIGSNDYLVRQLVASGIMPVMRVYTPNGRPIEGDLGAMVRHYRALGVRYFQLYNEPNNNGENVDGRPNVDRYVEQWSAAARVVLANGGLPGFGALSPGGNVDDLTFLDQALAGLKRRGQLHLLDRAWIPLHNYSFNRPVDYVGDQHSYLKFRLYNDIIQRHLGRSLPMIGTEGGTHPGQDFDKRYPVIDEASQVRHVLDGYRYLARPDREPYYFAFTYWIIANELGGGSEPAWSKHALFQPGYTSPIVDALKQMG